MSKNEELSTIENADLIHINGGDTAGGDVRVNPISGDVGVGVQLSRTDYSTCLGNNARQAREAFPDNRTWGQWFGGAPDANARPRVDFELANQVPSCGRPPGR